MRKYNLTTNLDVEYDTTTTGIRYVKEITFKNITNVDYIMSDFGFSWTEKKIDVLNASTGQNKTTSSTWVDSEGD